MSRIPCRKCRKCGAYHDLTAVSCCKCGADMLTVPALLTDVATIDEKDRGTIDEKLAVYAQKCPRCTVLNFTADSEKPVTDCYNCGLARIAAVKPKLFTDLEEERTPVGGSDDKKEPEKNDAAVISPVVSSSGSSQNQREDEEDEDGDAPFWSNLLCGTHRSLGLNQSEDSKHQAAAPAQPKAAGGDRQPSPGGVMGGGQGQRKDSPPRKTVITLTALNHGQLTFSVTQENCPYMLGRYANHAKHFQCDEQVGNEHCYLSCRDGSWMVKDNHSRNGTFVNEMDLGFDGVSPLNTGDVLKLGHKQDSPSFRITIT